MNSNFAVWLKNEMDTHKITQYRLKQEGIPQSTISGILSGKSPTQKTMDKIYSAVLSIKAKEESKRSAEEAALEIMKRAEPKYPWENNASNNLVLREESTYFADEIIKEAETMDLSPEEKEALETYKKMPPEEQQTELLETVMELLLDLPAKDREVIMKMIKAYALSLR